MNKENINNDYDDKAKALVAKSLGVEELERLHDEIPENYVDLFNIGRLSFNKYAKDNVDYTTSNPGYNISNYLNDAFIIQIEIAKLKKIKEILSMSDYNLNAKEKEQYIAEVKKQSDIKLRRAEEHVNYLLQVIPIKLYILHGNVINSYNNVGFDMAIRNKITNHINSCNSTNLERTIAKSDAGVYFRFRKNNSEAPMLPLMEKPMVLNTILANTILKQYIEHISATAKVYERQKAEGLRSSTDLTANEVLEASEKRLDTDVKYVIEDYVAKTMGLFIAMQVINTSENNDYNNNKLIDKLGLSINDISLIKEKYNDLLKEGNDKFNQSIQTIFNLETIEEIKLDSFKDKLMSKIQKEGRER